MLTDLLYGIPVALLIWLGYRYLHRVERHQESAPEPAYLASLLLSVACYWLPEVIVLLPVIWVILYNRSAMDMRTLFASLLGVATVALYTWILHEIGWLSWPIHTWFDPSHLITMIPTILTIAGIIIGYSLAHKRPKRRKISTKKRRSV